MFENSMLFIGFGVVMLVLGFVVWVMIAPRTKPKKRYRSSHYGEKVDEPKKIHEDPSMTKDASASSVFETEAEKKKPSPMEMTPEEAEATALPFQEPVVVRKEDYRTKRYTEPIPETQNIDTECFGYFKGASVLVVEDNLINQKILLSVLKKAGIHVEVANNGKEAVDLIESGKRYDLIIMDISMPVMDGIEATRRIRQHRELDDMPIVTFTAFNLGPEIKRMFDAGANAYLTKPLNVNQLYTVFTLFVGNPQKQELPFERMLEIHGLDIRQGLENFEGDESVYLEQLERFTHRYASTASLFAQWIEKKNYERAKLELRDMYGDALAIGAFDLAYFLKDLQKYFIYRNEHLISRHALMLKTKLQTLLDAVELYRKTRREEDGNGADSRDDLAQINEK